MNRYIFWILSISLCACHEKLESDRKTKAPSKEVSAPVLALPEFSADAHRKLIKTADYRMRVKNLNKSMEAIERISQEFPAHITSSNLTSQGNSIDATITIRVEGPYFVKLLKEIDKEASFVHYRNIKTEDVGKQFVDLESRLKTKREVQRRYEDILRKKAGTIEDVLAAERQIGNLQEEIESTISRLNYLKDEVAFSTINLQLYEVRTGDVVADSEDSMNDKFRDAFQEGFKGTVEVLIALTRIWPLLLIMTTVLVLYLRRKRESIPV